MERCEAFPAKTGGGRAGKEGEVETAAGDPSRMLRRARVLIDAKALGLRGTVASGRLAPAVVLRDPVCPVVQSVPGADIDEIEVGGNMKGRGRPEGGFKVNFAMIL